MEESGEPKTKALVSSEDFANNEDYLYAIDLVNLGYYWECHAYLESLWNEHGRKDEFAILFKAIIKIAAGLLKRELAQEEACANHLRRSIELLSQIKSQVFCGIELRQLEVLVSHMLSKPLESTPDFFIKLRF